MVAAVVGSGAEAAPCSRPLPVTNYLKAHPRWTVLDITDLAADDRTLWNENHKGFCPGMARVVLDDSGEPSYALALLDKRMKQEELVVLMAERGKFREVILERPFPGDRLVVWRSPPGEWQDPYGGRRAHIIHDSFTWEEMEAAAQQIYFSGGKFRRIQIGD
jgi:hypothetical protein